MDPDLRQGETEGCRPLAPGFGDAGAPGGVSPGGAAAVAAEDTEPSTAAATTRRALLEGLPPGYMARPLTLDDIALVYCLEAASETCDDGVIEVDRSDLEADWLRPDFDPAAMSMGVFWADELVAYAQVFQGRAEATVHPGHRAKGIGTALAHWTWRVARAGGHTRVGQTVSENEHAAEALFRSLGYHPTHTSWILSIELGPEEIPCPELPPGYRFRAYRPGDDDREVFELIDTAFEEWRGPAGGSMGFENWVVWALHEVPPDLVVLIEKDGRTAGAVIAHDCGPGAEAWIDQVAVGRAHRGQGLARALLQESFRRFRYRGRRRCGVSTDSRTNALTLYQHVGMSVRRTYTRWSKDGL